MIMNHKLDSINPEEVTNFLSHIGNVINEHQERHEVRKELDHHIKKIKSAPKKWIFNKEVNNLSKKIDKVINIEKKYMDKSTTSNLIRHLNQKIDLLQKQVGKLTKEKQDVIKSNKSEIENLRKILLDIRSKMVHYIKAKEHIDERNRIIEEKIKKVVKRPSP